MKNLDAQSKKLQNAFLQLKNPDEVFAFLKDLLTEKEILECSQRLEIAEMLYKNIPYKNIEIKTWASSTTIARVAKYLVSDFGGYTKVFKRLKI